MGAACCALRPRGDGGGRPIFSCVYDTPGVGPAAAMNVLGIPLRLGYQTIGGADAVTLVMECTHEPATILGLDVRVTTRRAASADPDDTVTTGVVRCTFDASRPLFVLPLSGRGRSRKSASASGRCIRARGTRRVRGRAGRRCAHTSPGC